MSSDFRSLKPDDVISIQESSRILISHTTFTTSEILQAAQRVMGIRENDRERQKWLTEGIDCRVLQPGNGSWKEGKVKITISVEFSSHEMPDVQTDSELDSLRQASFEN